MVYLLCFSQPPDETSITETTLPIRKHSKRSDGSSLMTPGLSEVGWFQTFQLHCIAFCSAAAFEPETHPRSPVLFYPVSAFPVNHCHRLLSSWIIEYRGFCLDWVWILQSNSLLSKCFHTSFILTTFQVIQTN